MINKSLEHFYILKSLDWSVLLQCLAKNKSNAFIYADRCLNVPIVQRGSYIQRPPKAVDTGVVIIVICLLH